MHHTPVIRVTCWLANLILLEIYNQVVLPVKAIIITNMQTVKNFLYLSVGEAILIVVSFTDFSLTLLTFIEMY